MQTDNSVWQNISIHSTDIKTLKETLHVLSHVPDGSVLYNDMAVECQAAFTHKVGSMQDHMTQIFLTFWTVKVC